MRRQRKAVALAAVVAVLFGLTPGAWGGGNTTPPGCLVESPTGGPEMSGSVAFKATNVANNIAGSVNVTLDLTFRNQQTETNEFITATLSNFDFALSPEGVACRMLDALRPAILNAFDLPSTKQLKICFSTNPSAKINCQSISRFSFDLGSQQENTNLGLAIIDRIFVVD